MEREAKCAFDARLKCNALTNKRCVCCNFFKTEKQLKEGRKKAEKRIRSLPTKIRCMLYLKYHGGDKYE